MFQSIEQELTFDNLYYSTMLTLQQLSSKKPLLSTTNELIQIYSDLVQHFDNMSQPISKYFQLKLKKLISAKTPKYDKQEAEVRKQMAESTINEKKIIHQMARDGPVEETVTKHIDTVEQYERRIASIIDQQRQQLLNRRKHNIKRSLSKSVSFTMSVDSVFDSPEKRDRKAKKMDTRNLFENLLDQQN